ncbi:AmiS/UreI family transporter [Tomitella cavernea]|uniref:AmiS/UreI family transporter n=1 Tax=Tomitella cavernea TaxID=1387982 RepID=A0ABP9C3W3_9ACTN|nr:AmiS/UreI family transporter [Tomitella cavernea]
MSSVGLLYVGAVLFMNGVMLLGYLTPREAAPINFFVGALQVMTPTVMILILADGDQQTIISASGLYLFGFTYLWVAINGVKDWGGHGLGWFSLFVAVCAVVYALHSFITVDDYGTGVLWLGWAVLWFLFFLVLGLDMDFLTRGTGVFTSVVGLATGAGAAFAMLLGAWSGTNTAAAIGIGVVCLVALVGMQPLGRLLGKKEVPVES